MTGTVFKLLSLLFYLTANDSSLESMTLISENAAIYHYTIEYSPVQQSMLLTMQSGDAEEEVDTLPGEASAADLSSKENEKADEMVSSVGMFAPIYSFREIRIDRSTNFSHIFTFYGNDFELVHAVDIGDMVRQLPSSLEPGDIYTFSGAERSPEAVSQKETGNMDVQDSSSATEELARLVYQNKSYTGVSPADNLVVIVTKSPGK